MSGVYICPYCLRVGVFLRGIPELLDELPAEYRCDCLPHHGQWMPVIFNGEHVGWVMLASDHLAKMRLAVVAPPN